MAQITFDGAARTVTGSKYLLEADRARVLIDCGLFQGLKHLRQQNWQSLATPPSTYDCVALTHAHIDHTGYLPRLVKNGFRGPVYCTPATRELTELLLLDSAKNQVRDAKYANRKGFTRHRPALPLYESGDARRAIKMLTTRDRGEWFRAAEPIWLRYHDAGHLLGSNMIEVEIRDRQPPLRVLFSGDVGRYDAPLYHDPVPPPACDVLICESTYGSRNHPDVDLLDELADEVNAAVKRGGVLLVSSFAVGRAQQLMYLLQILIHEGRIPRQPIYLDSPMSVDATYIYRSFGEDHDLSEGQLRGRDSVLAGPHVKLVPTVRESKKLNRVMAPAVIISSSGMMTGGRILHHLRQRLPDSRNTILLGGYMAVGTRGRDLQEGRRTIRIHGRDVPVRAAVTSISGLSGHAGRSELLRWLDQLPDPHTVYLTHGEPDSAESLADALFHRRGWAPQIPDLGETRTLEVR